ncbi:MAG: ABC transporter ATP-binding protein [Oscillospiraceae bacterium]|nr:ABC transporter ATP-binding protein [Oscillospiraceae bacterium]
MIEVKNLTKHYGSKKAVNDLSFTVQDGEILGFLGPNGAGKSTTMNILTGYISATDGQALINGIDILDDPIAAKKDIGYLPEQPPLYLDMTVKEYLNFIYDLKKCKIPRQAHIEDVCKLVKITDVYDRVIKHLSKGYKQRVGMAQALINNPKILILDEPTVGLDPKQILDIRNLIKRLGKKHTVILSSHILSEIQAVCDRIVIINGGVIVADDTTENLTNMTMGERSFTARIDGPREEVIKVIKTIPGVENVTAEMEREPGIYDFEIEAEEQSDIRRDLFRRMADRNWCILGLRSNAMTLEDIFLKITMGDDVTIKKKAEPGKPVDDDMRRSLLEQISGAAVAADIVVQSKRAAAEAEPEAEEDDNAIETDGEENEGGEE